LFLGLLFGAPVGTGCGKATAGNAPSEEQASYPYFWASFPAPTKRKKKRRKLHNQFFFARDRQNKIQK
jgi:hypothetical protein